jgi:hypothetical protein
MKNQSPTTVISGIWRECAGHELIIDSGEVGDKYTSGDNAAAAVHLLHLLLAVPPVFVVAHLPTIP